MPSLEWEENVFLGLKALYKSVLVSPKERSIRLKQCVLMDIKSELILVARILSSKDIQILETDDSIMYIQGRICLPKRIFLGESVEINKECYLLKTVVAALAIRKNFCAEESSLAELIDYCSEELPFFSSRLEILRGQIESYDQLFHKLPQKFESLDFNAQPSMHVELDEQTENSNVTELEGQGRTNVVSVKESDTGEQEMPFHTFEKAETLDEYNGLSRQNDAEDELLDHAEALSKLNMDAVLRTQDRSESIYRADIMLDSSGFEMKIPEKKIGIPYPEWDYKKRKYKNNWCYVQETRLEDTNPEWLNRTKLKYSSLILTLRKKFASIATQWFQTKRQVLGSEIDLDAVIELQVRLKTKEAPPEYLYLGSNRSLPDIATMILIDSSYSTDSWVQDRCVMDIMKDTVFCITEVLDDADQKVSIYGFSSNTRQSCSIRSIKTFDEKWSKVKSRLGSLNSVGYTRIGPSLRHAYKEFSKIKSEKKLLILLTDGKPCDYDRYEGRYGIEDVRKAISEGKSEGINTHAFAVDKQARDYFPIMFTRSNFDIVSHPSKLTEILFQLYLRLQNQ